MIQEASMLCQSPILFHTSINNWSHDFNWSFTTLSQVLKGKKFSCRLFPKTSARTLETECSYEEVTVQEFQDWLEAEEKCLESSGNPLRSYSRETHAGYIDYKYMKDVFAEHPEILDKVQWNHFGLEGFNGSHSTIWLGSEGANTTCHQDSYGFNLVSQIHGRKLWILFPPEDSHYLYPTRIPYEESSVFSDVNIRRPDLEIHPLISSSHPYIVVLHPGQTLYVPHHWWHYVESLDPSISINVWVPVAEDDQNHLQEALTRCLATSLISEFENCATNHKWLNPTEKLYSPEMNLEMLASSTKAVMDTQSEVEIPVDERRKQVGKVNTNRNDQDETNSSENIVEKNNHLLSFYDKIQHYTVERCKCPFGYNRRTPQKSRKRRLLNIQGNISTPSSAVSLERNFKVQKSNSQEHQCVSNYHDTSSSRDSHNDNISSYVDCDHNRVENGGNASQTESPENVSYDISQEQRLIKFSPCTFKEYTDFLNVLGLFQNNRKCVQKDNESRSEFESSKESAFIVSHSSNSVDSGITETWSDGPKGGDKVQVHSPVVLDVSPSTKGLGNSPSVQMGVAATHEPDRSVLNSSNHLDNSIDRSLSSSEVADCLLNSVLHPEVVFKIQQIFMSKCEKKRKQKSVNKK